MKKLLEDLKNELEVVTEDLELLHENGMESIETVAGSNPYNKEKMYEMLLESLPKRIKQLERDIEGYEATSK
jgi:hypothetical protein